MRNIASTLRSTLMYLIASTLLVSSAGNFADEFQKDRSLNARTEMTLNPTQNVSEDSKTGTLEAGLAALIALLDKLIVNKGTIKNSIKKLSITANIPLELKNILNNNTTDLRNLLDEYQTDFWFIANFELGDQVKRFVNPFNLKFEISPPNYVYLTVELKIIDIKDHVMEEKFLEHHITHIFKEVLEDKLLHIGKNYLQKQDNNDIQEHASQSNKLKESVKEAFKEEVELVKKGISIFKRN